MAARISTGVKTGFTLSAPVNFAPTKIIFHLPAETEVGNHLKQDDRCQFNQNHLLFLSK
jgi:hypothetical protein